MDQFLKFFQVFFSLKWIIKVLPTPDSVANWCICQRFTLVAQYLEYIFYCVLVIDYKTFFVPCMPEA